jgi:hypothetical protein
MFDMIIKSVSLDKKIPFEPKFVELDKFKLIQLIKSQPILLLNYYLILISLSVATKMSSSPPAKQIGDYS